LRFPEKLWILLHCVLFETLWWGHDGKYFVIDEEMFKQEVLGWEGPFRLFETNSMKSIIHQLNHYGFTKVPRLHLTSASLPESPPEQEATAAHRKLLVYYNPFCQKDHPELLAHCRRR
ncbi:HSFY1 protein, partial [Alectura lathami]|nr:HSFY1 protein [Alectura lathami]